MMKAVRVLALAAGALAVGAAAHAQQPRAIAAMFERFDTDGDGAITEAEVQAWRAQMFEAADTDRDGYLTREEVEAYRAEAAAQGPGGGPRRGGRGGDMILMNDVDGDGRLARAEFVEAPAMMINRFDANADGRLTLEEAEAAPRRRGRP